MMIRRAAICSSASGLLGAAVIAHGLKHAAAPKNLLLAATRAAGQTLPGTRAFRLRPPREHPLRMPCGVGCFITNVRLSGLHRNKTGEDGCFREAILRSATLLLRRFNDVQELDHAAADPNELLRRHELLELSYRVLLDSLERFRAGAVQQFYFNLSPIQSGLMEANTAERILQAQEDETRRSARLQRAHRRLQQHDMLERLRVVYGSGVFSRRIGPPPERLSWLTVIPDACAHETNFQQSADAGTGSSHALRDTASHVGADT